MIWQLSRLAGSVCVAVGVCLTSCSPRFGIYNVQAAQVDFQQQDFYGSTDSIVSIGYEFWSNGGAPWVTLRNETAAPLYLNLAESNVRLDDLLMPFDAGELSSLDGYGYRDRFGQAQFTYRDGRPHVQLAPGEWLGFELPPLVFGSCAGSRRQMPSSHCGTFRFEFSDDAAYKHVVRHAFRGTETQRLKRKVLEDYALSDGRDDEYFADRRPNQEVIAGNGLSLGLEILLSILFFL